MKIKMIRDAGIYSSGKIYDVIDARASYLIAIKAAEKSEKREYKRKKKVVDNEQNNNDIP